MVRVSKTEVGDSIALLLGEIAALGVCQPDGTFVTGLADLAQRLAEMAATGEAACVDGLAIRVQRPAGWANQKVQRPAISSSKFGPDSASASRIWSHPNGCSPLGDGQPEYAEDLP